MKEIHPDQCTTIYLEEFKGKNPKNVKEIITALHSGSYNTSVETFYDSLCTELHCVKNKFRSFDDIYYLCKSYLPATTEKEIMHELVTFTLGNTILGFSDCSYIRRIKVFTFNLKELREHWPDIYTKQINFDQFDSQWNWKELFNLLDIKSDEDLTNYREKYGIIQN